VIFPRELNAIGDSLRQRTCRLNSPNLHFMVVSFIATLLVVALCFHPAAAQQTVKPPQGVAPVFYIMADRSGYQEQYAKDLEGAGAMGGWYWRTWAQFEQQKGQYNFSSFDAYLNAEGDKKVRLKNGQVIRKPIALSIILLPGTRVSGVPDWAYGASGKDRKVEIYPQYNGVRCDQYPEYRGECKSDYRPPWERGEFQSGFDAMVKAFAEKYDNDPRVNSIWIATGLYGETVTTTENEVGCSVKVGEEWKNCQLNYDAGFFGSWLMSRASEYSSHDGVLRTYRKYFKNKPLFIINSGEASRAELTDEALTHRPPIGIKFNALEYDLPHENVNSNAKYPCLTRYWKEADRLGLEGMLGYEHAFPENEWGSYWALLTGLSRRMTLIDLPIFEKEKQKHLIVIARMQKAFEQAQITRENSADHFPLWRFAEDHLGRNVTDTPSVWIVLRDSHYKAAPGASRYAPNGQPGDYEFFLYRSEKIDGQKLLEDRPQGKTVVVPTSDLPRVAQSSIIGRMAHIDPTHKTYVRRTDQAHENYYMYFKVDERWPAVNTTGFDIEIAYLDMGRDAFSLKYGPGAGQEIVVQKKGTNKFVRETFRLPDLSLKQAINEWGDQFRIDCRNDGDEHIHMIRVIPRNWQAPFWDFGGDPPPSAPTGLEIALTP
jgi:hypothetical protein